MNGSTKLIDNVFNELKNLLSRIQMEAFFCEQQFIDIHKKYSAIDMSNPDTPDRFMSVNCHGFDLEDKGKDVPLGSTSIYNSMIFEALEENLKNQINWLLVSVVESYETYVKELYAIVGYKQNNFWRCQDFGAIPIDKIEEKDLDWFRKRVRERIGKNNVHEILNIYRQRLSLLKDIEKDNIFNWNLFFDLKFIELLRHNIVHKNGKCNYQDFQNSLKEKTGMAIDSNSKNMRMTKFFIKSYFSGNEDEKNICLIDTKNVSKGDYAFIIKKFNDLFDRLKSHSLLLYSSSLSLFSEKPYWKRDN